MAMMGALLKTYFPKKMGLDPKKIVSVGIMCCTAKKYEASRKEMMINGSFPVDNVLTTREFSFMLKKDNILCAIFSIYSLNKGFGAVE